MARSRVLSVGIRTTRTGAGRRTRKPSQNLDGLKRHQRANNAGDGSEYTLLLAGSFAGWLLGHARPDTAIARTVRSPIIDGKLTVESECCARDERLAGKDAGVRDEVSRQGSVGAVKNERVGAEDFERVRGRKRLIIRRDPDVRVDSVARWKESAASFQTSIGLEDSRLQSGLGRVDLEAADRRLAVQDLPMEVAARNRVVVDNADVACQASKSLSGTRKGSDDIESDDAPIPEAARYWSAGQPRAPAPTTRTAASRSFSWAAGTTET